MKNIDFTKYWSNKSSSHNRDSSDEYYLSKALEHKAIMSFYGEYSEIIDYGCGAGELIVFILKFMDSNFICVDFSKKLLHEARQKINSNRVTFVENNAVDYSASSGGQAWMSCGAVGQYSTIEEMKLFIENFFKSEAEILFLFDCIDPLRYELIKYSCLGSYINSHEEKNISKIIARLSFIFFRYSKLLISSKTVRSIGEMGYTYDYRFWREIASKMNLDLSIMSSHKFEYRYHVVLRKK